MAKRKEKQNKQPAYDYKISDVEAKYRIFRNKEKYAEIKAKIDENGGYCTKRDKSEDSRCMCKQFRDRDSEGFCKCKLYYKEARTEKQAEAYKSTVFEANEKKEREIEKQAAKEEKAKELDE